MATAPVISDATLTPSGRVILPRRTSKKAVYSVRGVGIERIRTSFRELMAPGKRPNHVLFGAVNHPALRMLKPVPVDIAYHEGAVVARFKAIDEFGCGGTMSGALDDLGKTIAELFLGLAARERDLGSSLKQVYSQLSRYVAIRQQ